MSGVAKMRRLAGNRDELLRGLTKDPIRVSQLAKTSRGEFSFDDALHGLRISRFLLSGIKRPSSLPMCLHEPSGDQLRKLRFERGAVGTGEGDGFGVGEGFAGVEEGGELTGERGELRAVGVETMLEARDLLADAAEEEHEPGRPVGAAFAPCGLRAAEGEVVGFFVLLDDALQRAVGHMAVTGAEQQQRGEDA